MPPSGFHIISHSRRIQKELDRFGVPWGAQYELARGETLGSWSWDDVEYVDLNALVGPNAQVAPKVVSLMRGTQRAEPSDDIVWWVAFTCSAARVNNMR